jgi:hypothetical protein
MNIGVFLLENRNKIDVIPPKSNKIQVISNPFWLSILCSIRIIVDKKGSIELAPIKSIDSGFAFEAGLSLITVSIG